MKIEDLAGPVSTLVATVIGGFLVIFANWLTERQRARNEAALQEDRNAALMTAMFVIKNFIAESLNEAGENGNNFRSHLGGLRAAQKNLDVVISKSPPEVQYIMATTFGMSLRLSDFVAAVESDSSFLEIGRRHDLLCAALEEFEIYAGNDLSILSEDELRSIVTNPEDV
jgi:hypothetical protein